MLANPGERISDRERMRKVGNSKGAEVLIETRKPMIEIRTLSWRDSEEFVLSPTEIRAFR